MAEDKGRIKMGSKPAVAVVGTFESKAEEFFLKNRIERHGLSALTIKVGTGGPSPELIDLDLYKLVIENNTAAKKSRDTAIAAMIDAGSASLNSF